MDDIQLFNDDCFNIFPTLEDKSINLFILDLPYGQTACKWDTVIDLDEMWKHIKRIMKPNALIVFFCTAKFGNTLINANPKWFKYDLIWKKSRKVGFLSANKMPLRQHENIYVFKDKQGTYHPQKTEGKPYTDNRRGTGYYGDLGDKYTKDHKIINKGDRHPTSIIDHENIYVFKDKQGTYNPQKTEGKPYTDNRRGTGYYGDLGDKYTKDHKIINKGDRHPTSIIPEYEGDTVLVYKNPHKTIHRTQKPVELLEWLIKTYSNEGDTVMDFTMGSGTCGVACMNTKRKFIGVEMDKEIYDACFDRIEKHKKNL